MLLLPSGKICAILQTSMQKNKQSKCVRVKCRVYGELIAGRKPSGCGASIASRCCRHGRHSKTFLVAATLRHIGTRWYVYHNGKEGLFFMSNFSVKPLVYAGVSVALAVLFSYVFAIQTIFVRITFGFLPIAIYGAMYGPMKAGLVAAAADFIGTTLLGTSIFFPGFLVSGFLTGYIYGWFFYRKRITLRRACVPFFLVMVFIHLGLNTVWLTVFYHKAASAIFLSRLIKNLLCYPMEVGLFLAVYRPLLRFLPEQFPQPEASRPAPSTGA